MASLINTLYPPMLETFLPASPNKDEEGNPQSIEIPISISPYNNIQDIKKIHVSVVSQATNESVLKTKYISEDEQNPFLRIENNIIRDVIDPKKYDAQTRTYFFTLKPNFLKSVTKVDGTSTSAFFQINQYYKIQVRFDSKAEEKTTTTSNTSDSLPESYFIANRSYFSEWSNVCLVRTISTPSVHINNFEKNSIDSHELPAIQPGIIPIKGFMAMSDPADKERLSSYEVSIVALNKEGVFTEIESSRKNCFPDGISSTIDTFIDTNNFKSEIEKKEELILRIFITTNNGYSSTFDFPFVLARLGTHPEDNTTNLFVDFNNQEGSLKILFKPKESQQQDSPKAETSGRLFLTRSCSRDHYQERELMACVRIDLEKDSYTFIDNTVSSLYGYLYYWQYEINGTFGEEHLIHDASSEKRDKKEENLTFHPFFFSFEDAFLTRKNQQLPLRYNFQISNYKPVVSRVKVDTLGSKYPRFVENGKMNYRQFSISGLIASESDYSKLFFDSKKEIGADSLNLYSSEYKPLQELIRNDYPMSTKNQLEREGYNPTSEWYYTSIVNNTLVERVFREKVENWLNDGEPKLLRTQQEGNIPVMLTDITLTPVAGRNRENYSFSATAYEIGDGYSLQDLDRLGIFDLRKESSIVPKEEQLGEDEGNTFIPGQRYFEFIPGGLDEQGKEIFSKDIVQEPEYGNFSYLQKSIFSSLRETFVGMKTDKKFLNPTLHQLKITFHSKPHPFNRKEENLSLIKIDESNVPANEIVWGYKIKIKFAGSDIEKEIFINSKGYYQIPHGFAVKTLRFLKGEKVTLDYILSYADIANMAKKPSLISFAGKIVGQEAGFFSPYENLMKRIQHKYNHRYYGYERVQDRDERRLLASLTLNNITNVSFELPPYSVVNVYYKGAQNLPGSDFYTYLVGRTGVLTLKNDYPMSSFVYRGVQLTKVNSLRGKTYLEPWEYMVDKTAKELEGDPSTFHWESTASFSENKNLEQTKAAMIIPADTSVTKNSSTMSGTEYGDPEWREILAALKGYAVSSLSEIENPQCNTVYGVWLGPVVNEAGELLGGRKGFFFYGRDYKWYEIGVINSEDFKIIAELPVYGQIEYQGILLRREYKINSEAAQSAPGENQVSNNPTVNELEGSEE